MNERKLVVVTGGGIRLSAAIRRELSAAGYRVMVHANRHIETAQALARNRRAVQADLTTKAGVNTLYGG